jgi:hypothetical protein
MRGLGVKVIEGVDGDYLARMKVKPNTSAHVNPNRGPSI